MLVKVADRIQTTAIAVSGKLEEAMMSAEEPQALALTWRTAKPKTHEVEMSTDSNPQAI